jgi:hypothetical protein
VTILKRIIDGLPEGDLIDMIMLVPSTPLSPVLYQYGVDQLCGSYVERIEPVLIGGCAGESFRQIHHRGVRLVTMIRQ